MALLSTQIQMNASYNDNWGRRLVHRLALCLFLLEGVKSNLRMYLCFEERKSRFDNSEGAVYIYLCSQTVATNSIGAYNPE